MCECLHWSVFFFLNFRVFSASFPCQDSALVEVVLLLTIAGSRQHVAVIKSKEIGEKEWGGEKRLCDDFARKKKKKKTSGWLKGKWAANKMSVEETRKEPSPVEKCFCSLAWKPARQHTYADTLRAHIKTTLLLTCTDGKSTHSNTPELIYML